MKRVINEITRRMGIELIPQWRMMRLSQARKLRHIFDALNIECVLDVGANEGQFRDFLRTEVGFVGTIHSFEPIASLCAKMRERASNDKLWSIHCIALGREAGEREINVMASSVFSSFLEPSYSVVPEFRPLNTVVKKDKVVMDTLDSLVESGVLNVALEKTFLKLDTQGFDLEVLAGGNKTISRIPALQTEVSIRPIYENMPDMFESLKKFGNKGFVVSDLFLVSDDNKFRASEFDCIMIRDRK